jgi:branched-chain amino acid transport system ATP-binding protein
MQAAQPPSADAATGSTPALRATNLRVRYRGGAVGIQDVSFRIEQGQVVALLGPNGAGKTTSVRAVGGFVRTEGARVVNGSVELFGRDITNLEPHQTCALGIGLVPERVKVFANMTVAENLVSLGRLPERGRARDEAFEQVFTMFPILAQRRKQMAGRLSGGQQQMLAIARALLLEPRLLILDEMTLGLHHSLHPPLFEAVERVAANGVAVLIVDESAGFALQAASYCYLLNGGRVRTEGPAADFRGNELLAAGYVE